jgi:hypothetical protein
MTNGEKIKEIFPDTKIITQYDNPFGDRFIVFTLNNEDMQVNIEWWNAEYKEPSNSENPNKSEIPTVSITKNDCAEQNGCITCSLDDGDDCCRKLYEESIQELTTKKCTTCAYREIDGKPHEMCKSCVCGNRYKQEPRKGHWIYDKSIANWICSKCGETPKTIGYVGTGAFMAEHFKYCNHCGAEMEGSEEV